MNPHALPADDVPLALGWHEEPADDGSTVYVNDATGESTLERCANPECRAPFVATDDKQRACSRVCSKAIDAARRRVVRGFDRSPRVCANPGCGKPFKPEAKRQRYCSRLCCRRVNERAVILPARPCPICGVEYTPKNRKNRSACPRPECKRAAEAQRFATWYDANKARHAATVLSSRKARELRAVAVAVANVLHSGPVAAADIAPRLKLRPAAVDAAMAVLGPAIATCDGMVSLVPGVATAPLVAIPKRGRRPMATVQTSGPETTPSPDATAADEMPPAAPPAQPAMVANEAPPAGPVLRQCALYKGLAADAEGTVYALTDDGAATPAVLDKRGSVPWLGGNFVSRPRAVASAWLPVDGITCAYCGVALDSASATVDHKVPISRGGTHAAVNLTWCCRPCNGRKAGRSAEEYAAMVAARRDPWAMPSPAYGSHLPGAGMTITVDPRPTPIALGQARGLHGLITQAIGEGHDPKAPAWALVPWPEGCGWGVYLRSEAHVAALARTTREARLFDRPSRVTFGNPVRMRAPAVREAGRYLMRLDTITPVTIRTNGGSNIANLTPDASTLLGALTAMFPARIGLEGFDPATAEMTLVARATQPESVPCGGHLGVIRGWTGSLVVECNAVAAWLLECAARVGLGARTALGFGRVRVAPATVDDIEAIGHDHRRPVSMGRWFFTPHAVLRFAQRALGWRGDDAAPLPEALRRKAIAELVLESERAHLMKRIDMHRVRDGGEMWRGPSPRRLRYVVGPGDGPLPALVTVMPEHDRAADAPAPAEPTPMQRAAWPASNAAARDYVIGVGVPATQARRAIALDMAHATRIGEAGTVERWQGPEPTCAIYEVERDGDERTVVRVRVPSAEAA